MYVYTLLIVVMQYFCVLVSSVAPYQPDAALLWSVLRMLISLCV